MGFSKSLIVRRTTPQRGKHSRNFAAISSIDHRGLDFGVLVAANGIAGIVEHLTAANFLVSFSLDQ
jgi:hypothetical protein